MLNATIATGVYTRKTAELTAQSIVEIRFTEQEPGEAVAVYAQVSLTSAEPSSGRVNYGGRLICTLVLADGEKLCRMQKGAEFTHHADGDAVAPAQTCDCALTCERTSVRREGSSYVVSVVVGARVVLSDGAERSYIASLEGAHVKREEGKLCNVLPFSGESDIEDGFNLVATDVLVPSAQPVVLNCEKKTGYVEISGEIYLSLLAVREGSPVASDRVIPFKAEVPCERAVTPSPAYCRAEIKDMSVGCKVNEERGKCDVELSATLAFYGFFCEEEQATLITDAFSTENALKLTYSEEKTDVCTDVKVYSERVFAPCAVKAKLDYTCAFLAAALPQAEFSRTQDGVEGSITAVLLYSRNSEIHSTEVSMPFSVKLAGLNAAGFPISVAVCGISIRQRAEGECEGEAQLKICAWDGETRAVRYLSAAEEGEKKKSEDCAVTVHFPAAGDGLWETAKKLGAAPESVEASNPELSYPLTGKERILLFRGKK